MKKHAYRRRVATLLCLFTVSVLSIQIRQVF